MRRIIQLVLVLSLFFFGFLALNYYIFFRMGMLLDIPEKTVYILIMGFAMSYPVSMLLERTVSHISTRIFYTVSSVWLGISFFILYLLIGYEIVKYVFNIPPFTAGIVIIIIASVISVYSIINSIPLEVKEIGIPLRNLRRDMKIVQLSDIHMGSIRNSGFMKRIVEKTSDLNPDLVLITGDTVDGSAKLHSYMFDSINELNAPVYLVTGNHDVYEGLENVFKVLETTNINILQDEIIEFEDIQIIGINYSFEGQYLKKVLSKLEIDKSKHSILMYHLPSEIKAANEAGIDLQLSGHTHKGQIFPFNLLVKLLFPYFSGLYEYNETRLYVSQGTGTWGPPMRLGSRNEITLINLKKK